MLSLENKIPPPLLTLFTAAAMWWLSLFTSPVELTSTVKIFSVLSFIFVGALFALLGIISFRRAKTTINPLKPETTSSLVTTGIYQFTRNPMYLALVFFLLAWASYLASVWAITLIFLFMMYMQYFQIAPEEKALARLFNGEFTQYKKRVRTWL
ncbi:methyltransferase family protein [Colwellia ponticola]|uniref:Isoprenylcysteine carboxylmethyltransferase family protein n=1 Tax=Colwellia ponticola TaxID=2304625 RepID=A0A8H2PKA5_9GAMM|nr:isoprenylcysteine carboxylmethyltransferase family protein [Colwellia ponticola]TMM45661.1 isoprenylcysteine carboxylmethyltransferase family protein [Colwellia ponticola]